RSGLEIRKKRNQNLCPPSGITTFGKSRKVMELGSTNLRRRYEPIMGKNGTYTRRFVNRCQRWRCDKLWQCTIYSYLYTRACGASQLLSIKRCHIYGRCCRL